MDFEIIWFVDSRPRIDDICSIVSVASLACCPNNMRCPCFWMNEYKQILLDQSPLFQRKFTGSITTHIVEYRGNQYLVWVTGTQNPRPCRSKIESTRHGFDSPRLSRKWLNQRHSHEVCCYISEKEIYSEIDRYRWRKPRPCGSGVCREMYTHCLYYTEIDRYRWRKPGTCASRVCTEMYTHCIYSK